MIAAIGNAGDKVARTFTDRRATAAHQRENPPAKLKKANFCAAPTAAPAAPTTPAGN
jgi:hypothetical protein